MSFITPAVVALVSTVATTATTLSSTGATRREGEKNRRAAAKAAGDVAARESLLVSRADRVRQRRASGSAGQGTILGGAGTGSQAEIGRNVLLGQ